MTEMFSSAVKRGATAGDDIKGPRRIGARRRTDRSVASRVVGRVELGSYPKWVRVYVLRENVRQEGTHEAIEARGSAPTLSYASRSDLTVRTNQGADGGSRRADGIRVVPRCQMFRFAVREHF